MGTHIIIDFIDMDFEPLNDMEGLFSLMESINKECDLHVLGHLKHHFEPYGCSIIFLLAESHFSVHTFPERGKIHFDFYHCGPLEKTHQTTQKVAHLLFEKLQIPDSRKFYCATLDRV